MKKLDYLDEVHRFGKYMMWSGVLIGLIWASALIFVLIDLYLGIGIIMLSTIISFILVKEAYESKYVEAHCQDIKEETYDLKQDIEILEEELENAKNKTETRKRRSV